MTRKLKSQQRDDFRTEPLGKRHDRAAFTSGIEALDKYLKTQASQDVSKHVAACFVLTPDGETIAGFYTLSQYSVDAGALPDQITKKFPKYPELPATLLGRLALSDRFKGQRLGEFLLMDALYRSLLQSEKIASAAVIVDAKNEKAKTFYEHFDFIPLPEIPNRLFLLMKTIEELFTE